MSIKVRVALLGALALVMVGSPALAVIWLPYTAPSIKALGLGCYPPSEWSEGPVYQALGSKVYFYGQGEDKDKRCDNQQIVDDPLTYHWEFGDGGSSDEQYIQYGHTYQAADVYTATCTIDDRGAPVYKDEGTVQDSITVYIVAADLTMEDVPDNEEENPGGFVAVNDDDDDQDDVVDTGDPQVTGGDNDLVEVTLSLTPSGLPGSDQVRVTWTEQQKVDVSETQSKWDGGATSEIASGKTYAVSALPKDLYVEGDQASDALRDVEIKLELLHEGTVCHSDIIKVTVVDVDDVDATPATDGDNVGAASAANADETKFHVVTSKSAGNLTLVASVAPSQDEVKDRITWDGATQDANDKMKATISRGSSGRFPVTIKVTGRPAAQGYVWVVWGTFSSSDIATQTGGAQVTTEDQTTGPGMYIETGYDFDFTIDPQTIITSAERPDLAGANTTAVPGAANTHVVSGGTLAGGAAWKWDESRQIRAKIINPHLYPVADLPDVDGHLWNGQPAAETVPENYPADDVEGNDDTVVDDPQDDDPYTVPDIGMLTGTDAPVFTFRHSTGADDDTYEERHHFREFARLQIGDTWHRISDFYLWKINFKIKRVSGSWQDDGTNKQLDNAGW